MERSISKSKEYEKQNIKEPVGNFRIRKKNKEMAKAPTPSNKDPSQLINNFFIDAPKSHW